jgi:hypothetical protein
VTVGDADDVAVAFLVGLAAPDEHAQAVVVVGQVADVQGDQFSAAQCGGVAERVGRPGLVVGCLPAGGYR